MAGSQPAILRQLVDVARFAARTPAVPAVTITSTLRRTNSFAISSRRSPRPSAQRSSKRRCGHRPSQARQPSREGVHGEFVNLRGDRHLEQTAAMVPPRVVVKVATAGRRLARSFSRGTAIERLVYAMLVVIINSSSFRFRSTAFQIGTWSRNSRRIVPISRSTNGWDTGTYGIDLISAISSMRKLASQRSNLARAPMTS
jgi:hypothetical protein